MGKRILLAFLVLSASLSFAQQRPGSLRGTITDKKSGETLPTANVVIKDDAGSIVAGGSADFDGDYNINPVPPGSYTVVASFTGYAPVTVKGVRISPNNPTIQDFKLQEESSVLEEVVITYEAPLIDKTKSSKITTAEDIQNMAVRDITSVASQTAGVTTDADGNVNVRGARDEATVYFIDGIKVRGSANIPQAAIAQTEVITGGLPAQYGDAIGGVINTTTRGPSGQWFGNAEILTSAPFKPLTNSEGAPIIDGQNYNLGAFTIGGPIYKNDEGKSIVGFLFSSEFNYTEEPRPTFNSIPYLELDEEVYNNLKQDPISVSDDGTAINFNSEFVTDEDLNPIYQRPNSADNEVRFTGNIQIKTSQNTNLTLGGRWVYSNERNESWTNHIFNFENNSQRIDSDWQSYLRFQQTFPNEDKNALLQNVYYQLQFDFSRSSTEIFDPRFGTNFFEYGHTGNYDIQRTRAYQFGIDTATGLTGYRFVGLQDTGIAYTPSASNPTLSNYMSRFFELAGENPGLQSNNPFDLLGYGLPANGANPRSVYGLWNNIGSLQVGTSTNNSYGKNQLDQFRIVGSTNFDVGNHSLILGFEYEQRTDRAYNLAPQNLWTRMRLLQNQPNSQLDLSDPQPVFDGAGNYQDTIEYNYVYDPQSASQFSERVRSKLGLEATGTEQINVENLDPSFFSLDMFSANEIINPNGNRGVEYYGYDYTGNLMNEQVSVADFFNARDENGRLTRPVGAFRPLYIAGYIQDQFTFDNLTFNVGLRVDRFDLNQEVLKDPYILPASYQVSDLPGTELADAAADIPASIGQDFAVYVSDFDYNEASIVGYRNGDQFYNQDGEPIADPATLAAAAGGNIKPFLVNPPQADDPDTDVDESQLGGTITDGSLEDYTPQVITMPRVAFNFPITDEAIFIFHYDLLAQRPSTGNSRLNPFEYLDLLNLRNGGIINNPNLKPQRTTDYEVAFKQVLSDASALKIAAFYREQRDLLQAVNYPQAYPITYVGYGNRDFGTTKGLQLEYELRRTGNVKLDANYTLQFAQGTGSSATTGLNLARAGQPALRTLQPFSYDVRHQFLFRFDFRYASGMRYNGPVVGGKDILENFGVNLVMNAQSGRPYTKRSRAFSVTSSPSSSQMEGQINGARLPWQVTFDLRLNRVFSLGSGGKKTLDVYVQVLNLLNTQNVTDVYAFTGTADDDGFLSSPIGQTVLQGQLSEQAFVDLYNRRMVNPFNYSLPRRVRLGVSYNF